MKYILREKKGAVLEYIENSKKKTDEERVAEHLEKTGVDTGLGCRNSITGEVLPIYLADFVLSTVGTGMVVGVPAHDKRDFEFATKYGLPVIRVIEGPDGDRSEIDSVDKVYEDEGVVFNSDFIDGMKSEDAREKMGEYIKEKLITGRVLK